MASPEEDIQQQIDSGEEDIKKSMKLSFADIALGVLNVGAATRLHLGEIVSRMNYVVGTAAIGLGVLNAIGTVITGQEVAALRGALAQHQLNVSSEMRPIVDGSSSVNPHHS